MSHTFAILKVSESCFEEIRAKLAAAGYGDQIFGQVLADGPRTALSTPGWKATIDMHGLALQVGDDEHQSHP
jgi:hypothetical protein